MRNFAMIGAVALALAACSTATAPPPATNASAAPSATPTPATKVCAITVAGMYAAEAAYNVPAHAYVTADGTPALASRFAPVKARAKTALTAAYDALKKARLLYKSADLAFCDVAAEVAAKSAIANDLIPK